MKNIKTLLLLGVLLLTVSCKKDEVAAAATGGGTTTTTPKDLFSTDWSVSNNAWEFNYGAGNLTGTPFASTLTYASMATCTCTSTITGSQTTGSFEQNCSPGNIVLGTPTAGTCDGMDYAAGSSYTNAAGILNFCRAGGGSCTLSYH